MFTDPFKAINDLCWSAHSTVPLKWHYRDFYFNVEFYISDILNDRTRRVRVNLFKKIGGEDNFITAAYGFSCIEDALWWVVIDGHEKWVNECDLKN